MSKTIKKLKVLFMPFVISLFATVLVYTFFNWLLCIQFNVLPISQEAANFWGPSVLSGLVAYFVIWRRLKKFTLKPKNTTRDPREAIVVIAWVAFTAVTVITQEYVSSVAGKLTALNQISDISKQSFSRFYTVKHFYIDKSLAKATTRFETSGRNGENFEMLIYKVAPIFDKDSFTSDSARFKQFMNSGDTEKVTIVLNGRLTVHDSLSKLNPKDIFKVALIKGLPASAVYGNRNKHSVLLIITKSSQNIVNPNARLEPSAWLAIKYQKSVSNELSQQEKEAAYETFEKETNDDFRHTYLNIFTYLRRVGPGTDQKAYSDAIKSGNMNNENKNIILLEPEHDAFAKRSGDKLDWVFGSAGIGSAVFLLSILFLKLKTDARIIKEEEKAQRLKVKYYRNGFFGKWFVNIINLRNSNSVTILLIAINLLVFMAMVFAGLGFMSFQAIDLLNWGGNFRPYVLEGQYWRLFTCMFLHGGILHILFNMYGLLYIGIFLEPILKSWRYLFIYVLTGLSASIVSVWWHPATVGVGASGAIFGLYGVFLALLTTNLSPSKFKKPFLANTAFFVGYNLLMGLRGNTDNAAHIGGLVSGIILGYIFYPTLKKQKGQLAARKETDHLLEGMAGNHTDTE